MARGHLSHNELRRRALSNIDHDQVRMADRRHGEHFGICNSGTISCACGFD